MTRWDDKGRVYTHAPDDMPDEEFAKLVAARDKADAESLAALKRSGRLWNSWDDRRDGRAWR